jgi:hypothetical protein
MYLLIAFLHRGMCENSQVSFLARFRRTIPFLSLKTVHRGLVIEEGIFPAFPHSGQVRVAGV